MWLDVGWAHRGSTGIGPGRAAHATSFWEVVADIICDLFAGAAALCAVALRFHSVGCATVGIKGVRHPSILRVTGRYRWTQAHLYVFGSLPGSIADAGGRVVAPPPSMRAWQAPAMGWICTGGAPYQPTSGADRQSRSSPLVGGPGRNFRASHDGIPRYAAALELLPALCA